MVAAGMSGSMAATPRKSVGLGFDSRHVINFSLSFQPCELYWRTPSYAIMHAARESPHSTAHTRSGDFTSHMASTARVLNWLQHGSQPVASHKERKGKWLLPG